MVSLNMKTTTTSVETTMANIVLFAGKPFMLIYECVF